MIRLGTEDGAPGMEGPGAARLPRLPHLLRSVGNAFGAQVRKRGKPGAAPKAGEKAEGAARIQVQGISAAGGLSRRANGWRHRRVRLGNFGAGNFGAGGTQGLERRGLSAVDFGTRD